MLSWPSEFLGSGRKLPPDAGFLHPKWLGRRLLSWCHISLVHLAWPCYKPSGHAQMDWRSALTWLPGPTGQNSQFHCAFQELLKPFHHGSAPCKAQALRQHRFVQGQRSSLQLNRVMWWLSAFRCSPPNGNLGFHLDIRVEPCIWMVSKVLTHLQATKCHPPRWNEHWWLPAVDFGHRRERPGIWTKPAGLWMLGWPTMATSPGCCIQLRWYDWAEDDKCLGWIHRCREGWCNGPGSFPKCSGRSPATSLSSDLQGQDRTTRQHSAPKGQVTESISHPNEWHEIARMVQVSTDQLRAAFPPSWRF